MALTRIDNGFETLRIFLDRALGIDSSQNYTVSGRQLTAALVSAASHNTYVETVSDKADTLNHRIKASLTSMGTHAYLEQIKRFARIKNWKTAHYRVYRWHYPKDANIPGCKLRTTGHFSSRNDG